MYKVLYVSHFVSGNGTTLFTGEQLYLPGNNFIYLLQINFAPSPPYSTVTDFARFLG